MFDQKFELMKLLLNHAIFRLGIVRDIFFIILGTIRKDFRNWTQKTMRQKRKNYQKNRPSINRQPSLITLPEAFF